jgi:hypothetical protein
VVRAVGDRDISLFPCVDGSHLQTGLCDG